MNPVVSIVLDIVKNKPLTLYRFVHFYTLEDLKRRFHRVKIIKNVKSIIGISPTMV
jgi:hypothetical protein